MSPTKYVLPAPVPVSLVALAKSLLLHMVILGAGVLLPYLHVPQKVEEPPPPHVVEAVLISRAPASANPIVMPEPTPQSAPEPKAKISPPATIPTVEKPSAKIDLPRASEKETSYKKTISRPETKPVSAPTKKPLIKKPTMQADAFKAEIRQMQKEDEENQKATANAGTPAPVTNTDNVAVVNKYKSLIMQQLQEKWSQPPSTRHGMVVVLKITLLPGGEVGNVGIVKSSGNTAFDNSAEAAVRKANPFPVPDDAAIFNKEFRNITLKFNPENW